jgi:hypothetical protein
MKQLFVFFLLVLTVSSACRRDPLPKGALKKDVFISVLVDVHIAEALYDDRYRYKMDTLNSRSLYLSVLEKHKVTEDQMLKTTLYYSRNPKEYDKIFSEVHSRIIAMTEGEKSEEETTIKKVK